MAARYEIPFELSLDPVQTVHLTDHGGDRSQLTVRVRSDRVEAGWPADNTFDNPPRCVARVDRRADGVVVHGVIRESASSRIWAQIWVGPVALMLAVAVLGAVLCVAKGAHEGLPPLLIGGIGSVLFALMWRWQRTLRRPSFDSDAKKLSDGLTTYLTTGDGNRLPN